MENEYSFLHVLKSTLNEKYPNLKVDFYVSCRNRYVHMRLDQPLHSFSNYEKLINDIESIWTARKHNDSFVFFYPELIHLVKWKYDYVFLKKKGLIRELCFFRTRVCNIQETVERCESSIESTSHFCRIWFICSWV